MKEHAALWHTLVITREKTMLEIADEYSKVCGKRVSRGAVAGHISRYRETIGYKPPERVKAPKPVSVPKPPPEPHTEEVIPEIVKPKEKPPETFCEVVLRNLCRHPDPPYCPYPPDKGYPYCGEHRRIYFRKVKADV